MYVQYCLENTDRSRLTLLQASNYLGTDRVLLEASRSVVDMMQVMSVEQVRTMFALPDDLSREQKEKISLGYQSLERGIDEPYPLKVWEKIISQCGKEEILKLLLTCNELHDIIRESSWWRDQVHREIGPLRHGCKAHPRYWRGLYLTYLKGVVTSGPNHKQKKSKTLCPSYFTYLSELEPVNMDWVATNIELKELPEFIQKQYDFTDGFRCFSDRYDCLS